MGIIKSKNKIRFVYGGQKKSQSCEINKNYSNGKASISNKRRQKKIYFLWKLMIYELRLLHTLGLINLTPERYQLRLISF